MKVQSLAVIFAIIILPVIIILSYYIHAEIDTIAIQTGYDTKLIDATHDAMVSFELNTANEDLSSVADALRSIIDASTNVFFNSLATNLGMSNANRDYVQPYIPAILYTLYDGYYIYSPTRVPEVLVAGGENVVYIGDNGVTYNGNNSYGVGVYSFNEATYELDETDSAKSARQSSLYTSISNKYEYGQMLYKNKDGTYSPTLNGDTYYKQDYVLKSYMPYSARYKDGTNYDITINYTLDNYITIMGYIGEVYYSKTGYLIGKDVVTSIDLDGSSSDLLKRNEIDVENICLSGEHNITIKINPYVEDETTRAGEIVYTYNTVTDADGNILSYDAQKDRLTRIYEEIESSYNNYRSSGDVNELTNISALNTEAQNIESSLETLTAITYYAKAQTFSNWVYDNLGNAGSGLNIQEQNIRDDLADLNNENYTTEFSADPDAPIFHYNFEGSTKVIFDQNQNPENLSSNFASHKFDIIRNSIQYNLNLALSVYDQIAGEMDIRMPVISDTEWEKILQNVSIVSFMQGFNCGLKFYNNYAIVSSTNNELTVIPNEIYYVKRDEYNTEETDAIYHRIDCDKLEDTDDLISFRSKEVKYDKIYDKDSGKYKYDHKNFACYNCIVGGNYLKPINSAGDLGYNDKIIISALSDARKRAYYRAVAKARENIYKTNALTDSNGYETLYTSPASADIEIDWNNLQKNRASSTRSIEEIKALEITVKSTVCSNADDTTASFHARLNGSWDLPDNLVINMQETPQVITVPVNIHATDKLSTIALIKDAPADAVSAKILNIRVIYE